MRIIIDPDDKKTPIAIRATPKYVGDYFTGNIEVDLIFDATHFVQIVMSVSQWKLFQSFVPHCEVEK
jgi:hypothetical protein